jgi:FixJ family two-component response regulator
VTDSDAVVLVIDDDRSVRDALQRLLESVGRQVRCFESCADFLVGDRPDVPSCLILDIRMPGQDGLDFQRQLVDGGSLLPIIFVSGHGDIPMSVRAMKAGAIEFLTKPFREQDLLSAVDEGLRVDREQRQRARERAILQARLDALTAGEHDVLRKVAKGLLNKQIAADLGVSEVTVKVRRGHLMRKMEAGSLADLVQMAVALGLV